VLTTTNIIM